MQNTSIMSGARGMLHKEKHLFNFRSYELYNY